MIRISRVLVLATLVACAAEAPPDTGDGSASEPPGAGSGDEDSSSGSGDDGGGSGAGSGAPTPIAAAGYTILNHDYQAQSTGYWCGPAATRIALSTRGVMPTQQSLANQLGTDTDGTDHIGLVVDALNNRLGHPRYAKVEMPNDPPTPAQRDRLWNDTVQSIDGGHGMVVNIVAPATNHPPGYPNYTIYHYIAAIGYNPTTRQVYIADSANFGGNNHYWLSFDQFATLIPPKGYAYYRCGAGRTLGKIDERYQGLGGCNGFLGAALTDEQASPDGAGKFTVFRNGSIYWHPDTGAFEVHGAIRDTWRDLGWEVGVLGYPLSNETRTPDNVGRFSVFQRGSIYWTPQTGAHEVRGAIRDKWAETGWESGSLGYPISGEYAVPEGRRSDFQHGAIVWNASTNTTTVQ